MLLKQLRSRSSSIPDSIPDREQDNLPLKPEENQVSFNPVDYEKLIQDQQSNRLIKVLQEAKKLLPSFQKLESSSFHVHLQDKNQFKQRVEEYFKQNDSISVQQKFRALAPSTINNITITADRNQPLAAKPFLVAPFENSLQVDKFAKTQQAFPIKPQKNRITSAEGVREQIANTDEDKNQSDSMFILNGLFQGGKPSGEKRSQVEASHRQNKKIDNIRISSYSLVDKGITQAEAEKKNQLFEANYQNGKTVNDCCAKFKRRDSLDSDVCINFKTASTAWTKHLRTTEEDIHHKEGSLMKYFRTKVGKSRPASTNPAIQQGIHSKNLETTHRPLEEGHSKQITPNNRSRSAAVRQKDESKCLESVDTSLEGNSMQDSYYPSRTQTNRPATSLENRFNQKVLDKRRETNKTTGTRANTTYSSQINRKSNDSNLALLQCEESQLNYSEDNESPENSLIYKVSSDRQGISSKTKARDFIVEEGRSENNYQKAEGTKIVLKAIDAHGSRRYQNQDEDSIMDFLSRSPEGDKTIEYITPQNELISEREEEHEGNALGTSKEIMENELKESFDNKSSIRNMKELINYIRKKGQLIESPKVNKAEESVPHAVDEFEKALSLANLVETKGGIIQKILRPNTALRAPPVLRRDAQEVKEVYEEIEEITTRLQNFNEAKEESYRHHKERLEQAKKGSNSRLTDGEIDIVKEEFKGNKLEEFDVATIDTFLKRLKFFSELNQEVRFDFYRNAEYLLYEKGTYIFHQGDLGENMYVILRGSVNVKILKRMKDGSSQMVNVNSLDDGAHFGELAIMGENLIRPNEIEAREAMKSPTSRRAASIQCAEETQLLSINREKFQEILFSVMHKDVDAKVRALQEVSFFKGEEGFNLMPIANLLNIENYKLGQRIIREGEPLMNFYLISRGRCKVVKEIHDEYALNVDVYKKKLKPFKFKVSKGTDGTQDERNTGKYRDLSNPMRRTFDNEPLLPKVNRGSSLEKQDKFMKHIFYKELSPGICFGFRPLLKTDKESRYIQDKENHAKLSVIADSPDVEIYVLPRANLMFVPERIKNMLLDGISGMTDFDEGNISQQMKEHKTWRKYQVSLIQEALNKSEHPNLRRRRDTYKAN